MTWADFQAAETRVRPSAMREVALELPNVAWADVGGLDDVTPSRKVRRSRFPLVVRLLISFESVFGGTPSRVAMVQEEGIRHKPRHVQFLVQQADVSCRSVGLPLLPSVHHGYGLFPAACAGTRALWYQCSLALDASALEGCAVFAVRQVFRGT